MSRAFALLLALLLPLSAGCTAQDDLSGFDRGGERPPVAPDLPSWGVDNCGVPGAPGSPWAGSIALDWRLEDPFGRNVRLHQFCGRVILIESLRMDDPDLEVRLAALEDLRSGFAGWELAVVVLIANLDGSELDREELARLTLEGELGFPLLEDPEWEVTRRYTGEVPTGTSIQLYSPGLVLEATELSEVDASDVEALLPQGGVS